MYWLLSALLTLAWLVGFFGLGLGIGSHALLVGAVVLAEVRLISMLNPPAPFDASARDRARLAADA